MFKVGNEYQGTQSKDIYRCVMTMVIEAEFGVSYQEAKLVCGSYEITVTDKDRWLYDEVVN